MDSAKSKPLQDHAYSVSAEAAWGLVVALVFAVAEPHVRYAFSSEPLQLSQLARAVFANAALLGLPGLAAAWILAAASQTLSRGRRRMRLSSVVGVPAGLVAAWCVFQSDAAGFAHARPMIALACALLSGVSVTLFIRRRRNGVSYAPSGGVRTTAIAACVIGTVAFGVAIRRTAEHAMEWAAAPPSQRAAAGDDAPNILLVVIDTLRADRVGVHNGKTLTPNLDRLAESSVVFTDAISTAPWTLPSHASLFTGLYPDKHGVSWGHYKLESGPATLAELLLRRGYETFGVSNNWLLSRRNGFDRGFDDWVETSNDAWIAQWRLALQCGAVRLAARAVGLAADAGFDAGSAWTNWLLRKRMTRGGDRGRPFFAFVNYFEPHDPYYPPPRFAAATMTDSQRAAAARIPQSYELLAEQACGSADVYSADQIKLLSKLYDAEVAYQDEAVGGLLSRLKASGLFENTWIVVMADHGELFGEQGMLYHTAGSNYELLHVPLIVRPPGGARARRSDVAAQPVDVFATLASAGGAALPSGVRHAHRLPLNANDSFPRQYAVALTHGASIAGLSIAQRHNMQADYTRWMTWVTSVCGDGKLLELTRAGPRGFYDIHDDPAMNENLIDRSPIEADRVSGWLEHWAADASSLAWQRKSKGGELP